MEIFSRFLKVQFQNKRIDYHPRCRKASITHLLFADDVLLFAKANVKSIRALRGALSWFADHSGLVPNGEKSKFFTCDISLDERSRLAEILNMGLGRFPVKYLGIPLNSKSLRAFEYDNLTSKLTEKIQCWEARDVSYAGRLVLLKSTLSAMSLHWCKVFLLPASVIKRLNSICRSYFWSGSPSSKRCLVKRRVICTPKECGGLGLIDVRNQNIALLLRNFWCFANNRCALWSCWVSHYICSPEDIWTTPIKHSFPWLIKKLLSIRNEAQKCVDAGFNWRSASGPPFSVRGTRNSIVLHSDRVQWWSLVWKNFSLSKHKICAWMVFRSCLPTKLKLLKFMEVDSPSCPLCESEDEDQDHLFGSCPFFSSIWSSLCDWMGTQCIGSTWTSRTNWFHKFPFPSSVCKTLAASAFCAAIYYTWSCRNRKIFKARPPDWTASARSIICLLKRRLWSMKGCRKFRRNAWVNAFLVANGVE